MQKLDPADLVVSSFPTVSSDETTGAAATQNYVVCTTFLPTPQTQCLVCD